MTAALFFFKRRQESCRKFNEGVAISSRSFSVFFVRVEIHQREYQRLKDISFPLALTPF